MPQRGLAGVANLTLKWPIDCQPSASASMFAGLTVSNWSVGDYLPWTYSQISAFVLRDFTLLARTNLSQPRTTTRSKDTSAAATDGYQISHKHSLET